MVKNGPLQVATTSRVQQQPCHKQQVNHRQFTKLNMLLSQVLQHLLRLNLVTLVGPHPNHKTSSPNYNPDVRCAYHSNSPGHDTDDCWKLKYKIQNLIDEGALEFTQDGQLELFYHPSRASA